MIINVDENIHFQALNKRVRDTGDKSIVIDGCIGQRYIGTGIADKTIEVYGTPGNAMGAYLNGGTIYVYGNALDGRRLSPAYDDTPRRMGL